VEFRILGPLEVFSDGQALDLGGAKQRALLAVLLLDANNVVSTDRLIDALWEDEPPETAAKALQVYVSSLRKLLGKERVETRPPGYRLAVAADEFDLERFRELQEGGRPAQALALWRGGPLSDFAHARFAQAEIARLEDLRLACLEERIDQDLAEGRGAELTGELEALVAEHPLRERPRGQLMLALYRSGRQAEALDAYQAARRALVEELGIEPGRELRDLHQRILNQDPSLDEYGRSATEAERDPGGGFVGRERELAELTAALGDAFAGRGRLVLLQGEPGIGKSRLADELMSRAKARGANVLVGRCWEAGGAPAYWPWTQSLRAYLRTEETAAVRRHLGSHAADVAQIVPELREHLPGLPEPDPEPFESDVTRFRLFDSTATFLRTASADRPLVLGFDDLHAADEPSLLLLQYVASVVEDSRILIVGTFRDLDPTVQDPLESTVAELGRVSATRRIRLDGLSQQEVARLAELTGGVAPPERLIADLYADTEGNPLFVSEIVRLLAAEGRLEGAPARMPIPETIREAIGRRLRTLSGECRRVLSLGSVFGREFGLVALERVADYTGIDKLLSVLDEAITARVVEQVPGSLGRLRFEHALIRETLYEEIPATHRARLHRRVAEVLEALYAADPEPHLAELAHHFSLAVPAAPPDKAVEYGRRAGDRALARLAFEEAARLYELALAVADGASSDERVRCELFLLLGEARSAGDRPAAKEAFLAAAEIARRQGLAQELARASAGYGGWIMYARAGDDGVLVPLLEEGLAALGERDVVLRARLLARLAGALRDEPSPERRDRLSMEAVELARRADDPVALAYALDGRAAAIMAPDTVEECLALGTELREIGERIGNEERVVQGEWQRIIAHVMTGDMREAEADVETMSRLVHGLGRPVQLWQVSAARAMLGFAAGRIDEAEEHAARAFELGERAQPEMAIGVCWIHRFTLAELRGSLGDVAGGLDDMVSEHPARPVFRCALAYVDAALGRAAEARHTLGELTRDDCSALPFDMEWLYGMSLLAETSHVLDDAESASTLYRLLEPWALFNTVDHPEGIRGCAARYLGLLATTLRRPQDASRHYETAMEVNDRMGARPWLAFTQEDYARMLLRRSETDDPVQARELLDSALSTYRELGMEPHAARAATLARSASRVGPASSTRSSRRRRA
jgi:DNA-binding SARP family transcriptional activator/tetratricopeptide (TPR) repeat protein